jgi:hypothetical protein
VARGSGRVTEAFCCSRNRAPVPLGRSPADQAAECACVATLPTASVAPPTEPLAHALISACCRTPPVLGFTQLYRTGACQAFRPSTPLQLSSYRTLPAAAFLSSSRSSPDQSSSAMDDHLMAGKNKESRSLIASFLRRWTEPRGLHRHAFFPEDSSATQAKSWAAVHSCCCMTSRDIH